MREKIVTFFGEARGKFKMRNQQTFTANVQAVNILGFVGHTVSVASQILNSDPVV